MRWICLFILLWFALMLCISCSVVKEQQDRMVMWTFKEYRPWIRYGLGEGLIEHWIVEGLDHFVYVQGNTEVRKPGDTAYWPIPK